MATQGWAKRAPSHLIEHCSQGTIADGQILGVLAPAHRVWGAGCTLARPHIGSLLGDGGDHAGTALELQVETYLVSDLQAVDERC